MRRRFLCCTALLTTLVLSACSDAAPPTNASLTPYNRARPNVTLADYIQEQIFILLPKGFEDAVDARWATVRQKKAAGDMVGAAKHLATLVTWIDKKTAEITLPVGATETKEQAAVRLTTNMTQWLYGDENAPPVEELEGEDVVLEVVPAGQPSGDISPPSDHSGVSFGPQNEDRIVIISEEDYPGNCNGPLPTARCQYPLFYKIEIFPNTRLIGRGRFAVCTHIYPHDRRPIEYPQDDGTEENPHHEGPVHQRLRLAHNLNPLGSSQGGTTEGQIEILEKVGAGDQTGLARCEAPNLAAMSAPRKAIYALTRFVGGLISPKSAHAIDQGPEHYGDFASNFNAIDPESGSDVAVSGFTTSSTDVGPGEVISVNYSVTNPSRRSGGHATAASQATSTAVYIYSDAALTQLVDGPLGTSTVAAMAPDGGVGPTNLPQTFNLEVTAPSTPGTYWVVAKVVPDAGDPNLGGISEVDLPDARANNVASYEIVVRAPGGSISGTLVDAFTNAAISGATVSAGGATTTTASNGTFQLEGVPAGTHSVIASAEGYNNAERPNVSVMAGANTNIGTMLISPTASGDALRIVLEWDDNPADMDSHLTGPKPDGSRFHVYYATPCYPGPLQGTQFFEPARSVKICPSTDIASLDVDDVSGFGPETITLKSQISGTYSYYVHKFSGFEAITQSNAIVHVFRGAAEIASFNVPTTGSGVYWHVFNLSGGVITTVNAILGAPPSAAIRAATSTSSGGLTVVRGKQVNSTDQNDLSAVDADIRANPKQP